MGRTHHLFSRLHIPLNQSLMLSFTSLKLRSIARSMSSSFFLNWDVSNWIPHFGHLTPRPFSSRKVLENSLLHSGHLMSSFSLSSNKAIGRVSFLLHDRTLYQRIA